MNGTIKDQLENSLSMPSTSNPEKKRRGKKKRKSKKGSSANKRRSRDVSFENNYKENDENLEDRETPQKRQFLEGGERELPRRQNRGNSRAS